MSKYSWIVQLKPLDVSERTYEKALEIQNIMIDKNILGMGWGTDALHIPYRAPIKDYAEAFKGFEPERGKTVACNGYRDMEPGDPVMTRLADGRYYIARIKSSACWMRKSGMPYDHLSWGCEADQWRLVEDVQNIPAIIRGKYSVSYQNTVIRINNSAEKYLAQAMEMLYERVANPESSDYRRYRMRMDSENFPVCLDYKELENLVYLYMREKNPEYILLPSTCKMSQPLFEFWMTKGPKRNIVCQVKNQINPAYFPPPSAYSDYSALDRIYLFCGKWTEADIEDYEKKVKESNLGNIEIIRPEDLFGVLRKYCYLFNDEYRYVDGTE